MNRIESPIDLSRNSGWMRLWIFSCAVLFFMFAAYAGFNMPMAKSIQHEKIYQAASEVTRALLDGRDTIPKWEVQTSIEMPNGHKVQSRIKINKSNLEEDFSDLIEYASILNRMLLVSRLVFAAKAILAWCVTCAALLGIGIGIGWVRSGFSNQRLHL